MSKPGRARRGACCRHLRADACCCCDQRNAFDILRASLTSGLMRIGDVIVGARMLPFYSPSVMLMQAIAKLVRKAHPGGVVIFHVGLRGCCRFRPDGRVMCLCATVGLHLLNHGKCLGFVVFGSGVAHLDVTRIGELRRDVRRRRRTQA